MLIQKSAVEIGQYGYSHYTHKPVTPGEHDIVYVPQSIADGWEAYCSCGEWRAFENFYAQPSKEGLLKALKEAFAEHAALK
jgi:hypothetical protein